MEKYQYFISDNYTKDDNNNNFDENQKKEKNENENKQKENNINIYVNKETNIDVKNNEIENIGNNNIEQNNNKFKKIIQIRNKIEENDEKNIDKNAPNETNIKFTTFKENKFPTSQNELIIDRIRTIKREKTAKINENIDKSINNPNLVEYYKLIKIDANNKNNDKAP
jgi:hypothetical protein